MAITFQNIISVERDYTVEGLVAFLQQYTNAVKIMTPVKSLSGVVEDGGTTKPIGAIRVDFAVGCDENVTIEEFVAFLEEFDDEPEEVPQPTEDVVADEESQEPMGDEPKQRVDGD